MEMVHDNRLDPWENFKPKYHVHKEAYAFFNRLSEVGGDRLPFDFNTIEKAREHDRRVFTTLAGSYVFYGTVCEVTIPLATCHNYNNIPHITAQVYQPTTSQENPTIWVYFHGGGHIMGCSESYKTALQMVADRSDCIVVSVDYRLLPHTDKCAPMHDCIAATRWVAQDKARVGGNRKSKLGIGGDSSGGHVTACVANEVPDLDFQILVYPFTDPTRMQPSRMEFANDPFLPKTMLDWSFDLTVRQMPDYLTDPKINPMIRDIDKKRCPPALVIVAELDPFRDDGIGYARKLREAGVDVNVVTLKGIPHFFFNLPDTFPTTCANVYNEIASYIKRP